MAKFQEVIMKIAETHPNAPLTAARKSILQDRMSRLLSQSQTPDHPPYAAMIERALKELNEKWGSSEDSISKSIEKEFNNLPCAHSTLLKHHLVKLCESGDVVTRGQRYMLAGAIPSLNSSTIHQRKKRKKKWKLNWDWQRQRYKPRKKLESKPKNQQNGDQNEVTEDHKESQGLENHISESNAGFDPNMEHPITQEPLIFRPLKDRSVGPTGLELVSTEEFCQSLRDRIRLPEPKAASAAAAATTRYMKASARYSPQLKLSNLESLRDQQKTAKNSTPVTDQRAKLRSYRKQDEPEQFDVSKTDEKEVVQSFVNGTEKLGAKKRGRKRKTLS